MSHDHQTSGTKENNRHNHAPLCPHESLGYCAVCKMAYCKNCSMEWSDAFHVYPYQKCWDGWYSNGDNTGFRPYTVNNFTTGTTEHPRYKSIT